MWFLKLTKSVLRRKIYLGLKVLFFLLGNMSVLSESRHHSSVRHSDIDCFFVSGGIRTGRSQRSVFLFKKIDTHINVCVCVCVCVCIWIDNNVFFGKYFDISQSNLSLCSNCLESINTGVGKLETCYLVYVAIYREDYLKLSNLLSHIDEGFWIFSISFCCLLRGNFWYPVSSDFLFFCSSNSPPFM